MLNMGFVDDVEMILNAGGSSENMQTLLFSATLPPWVKDITRRFLRKEQRLVDLVGNQKMKVVNCLHIVPVEQPVHKLVGCWVIDRWAMIP